MTAFARFLDGHPAYSATRALDELRASEYGRLESQGQAYLDYTGGGLYADSQVREHARLLSEHVFGNPHSALINAARDLGCHVLLDGAAFVPTNRLDLRAVTPDFVTISFYKMFGYPTGVGCLLIRNATLNRLRRPWFAGGTVNFATVQGRLHVLSPREAGFEDGTLNYLSIPAVEIGLRHLDRVGMDTIHTRVHCLTDWLLTELLALRHSNGRPMVRVYGPATSTQRGGTVTMNFYDPTVICSITGGLRSSPGRRGSRSGPDASAIPARAKRPKA